jgi:hypothetical protein
MKKFKHKDSLSHGTLKRENSNKYNKFERTIPPIDMSEEYEFTLEGWRKKNEIN